MSCCGFAYRAGYRNDLIVRLLAVMTCKITECFYGIIDFEQAAAACLFSLLGPDYGTGCTFCKSIGYLLVAVKFLAGYGKKTISRLGGA